MKCMYCGGNMKQSTAPFNIYRKGIHLTLEALPAWVCQQCGEPYFAETEVDAIQAILQEIEKKAPQLAVADT